MAVTTIVRSWNDCNVLEQMQRRYLKIRVSVVFTTGPMVFVEQLTCIFCVFGDPAPSLLRAYVLLCSSEHAMESLSSPVSTLSNFRESFALNTWNPPFWNCSWMQSEKDIAPARSRSGQRAWRTKNLCFVSVLLQMKRNIHWNMLMSQEEDF